MASNALDREAVDDELSSTESVDDADVAEGSESVVDVSESVADVVVGGMFTFARRLRMNWMPDSAAISALAVRRSFFASAVAVVTEV